MYGLSRHVPDLLIFFFSLAALAWLTWSRIRSTGRYSALVLGGAGAAACLLAAGAILTPLRYASVFPPTPVAWVRGGALGTAGLVLTFLMVDLFWRTARRAGPQFDPERRRVLSLAKTATFAAPVALGGFAIVNRNDLRLHEAVIRIPALPDDLNGLRIAQLSDIHMGPFLSRADLERAVAMANETKPHITLVTGDLISVRYDPLDTCLDVLKGLRSDAGVLGCLGNHEVYAGAEQYATVQAARRGMIFLRSSRRPVKFGAASLNIAGVDYQRFGRPYLTHSKALLDPSMPNILLSHNPDVFPTAAEQGWDVTISGHTHGGQVNVEVLSTNLNIMRFYTPYVYGVYREGPASVFVTRGIGTIGVPARFGAPPEVALIRLERA